MKPNSLAAEENAVNVAKFDPVKSPFRFLSIWVFIDLILHFLITEKEALLVLYMWKTLTETQVPLGSGLGVLAPYMIHPNGPHP